MLNPCTIFFLAVALGPLYLMLSAAVRWMREARGYRPVRVTLINGGIYIPQGEI